MFLTKKADGAPEEVEESDLLVAVNEEGEDEEADEEEADETAAKAETVPPKANRTAAPERRRLTCRSPTST